MRLAAPAAIAAAIALGAGCGDDGDGPLADAADHLAVLDATSMTLELRTTTGEAEVGFTVDGDIDLPGEGGGVPVADLRTTSVAGDEVVERQLLLTGDAGFVVAGDEVTQLPDAALDALTIPADGDGPVALHLDDWVVDPRVDESGDTTTVTGPADVAVVLADLAALARGFAAHVELPPADDDALDAVVRSSQVVAVLQGDDHELRTLEVTIELGAAAETAAVEPVTIQFSLELEPLADELVVEPPQ